MKFYILSPEGVPPNPHLFPMFIETWKQEGVQIVDRIEDSDIVLIDLHSRIAEYKQHNIDWLILHGKKIAVFDEWDRGNMSKDEYPNPLTKQQEDIFKLIRRKLLLAVNFCRLLDKNKKYTFPIFPYEKPILYEEPLLTPDELFNREFDAAFIANHSPSRQAIAEAFQGDHRLKTFISIGAEKKPFDEFVNWHKRAKFFISSGAGGFTDERKQYLFSVAALIQEDHNQLLQDPFTSFVNCIKISTPPTQQELDNIYKICNNREFLYELYITNYNFMKMYYSKEYIAKSILEKIKRYLS